jgi:mono/diheme cytochrome c family protein
MDGSGSGPNAALFAANPRDLHEGFLDKYSTDDLVRRVLDGQQLKLAIDRQALRARAEQTEIAIAYLRRLPTLDWELLNPGWAIYMMRCQSCHGEFGHPRELSTSITPPPDFSTEKFQSAITDRDLLMAVMHGRKGMPALTPRLNPEEALQLLAFLRLLSPGFELYSRYCAACHADDGGGAATFGDSMPAPQVVFDEEYFTHTSANHLRGAVWHMLDTQLPSMPHYRGTITKAKATAIIEFLKERDKLHRKQPTSDSKIE